MRAACLRPLSGDGLGFFTVLKRLAAMAKRKHWTEKHKEEQLEGYVQEIERLVGKKVGRILRREIRKFNAAKRTAGQTAPPTKPEDVK